jgi:uncharacterized protein
MSLKDKINDDLKSALKAGDSFTTGVLRLITAAIGNKEIDKRASGKESLTDEEIQVIVASEAKKRKESITAFKSGGRNDLAEKEEKELSLINAYLPKQMGEDEVRGIIEKIFSNKKPENIGEAMKAVMPELKGKADGSLISKIVKENL